MTQTPTPETYHFFQQAYDYFNRTLFEGVLPPCLITFQRQKRLMGYVSFKRWFNRSEQRYIDELAINPEYFAHYPLIEIFQTLCHEMVHIWQAHSGQPSRRGYHNEEWARKMIDIGLMPSATGEPGGAIVGQTVSDYILEDGAFLQACEGIMATGLQLDWVDAFPVERRTPATPVYSAQAKTAAEAKPIASVVRPVVPDMSQLETVPDDPRFPFSLAQLQQAFLESLPFQPREDDAVQSIQHIPSTRPLNKSNRHKYYCKGCHLKVWGKPDLNIRCDDCDLPLLEEE